MIILHSRKDAEVYNIIRSYSPMEIVCLLLRFWTHAPFFLARRNRCVLTDPAIHQCRRRESNHFVSRSHQRQTDLGG